MEWLINFIKNKPVLSLFVPSVISLGTFLVNLMVAASDGTIDTTELHQLMGSANGVEMVILILVMVILNKKNNSK